MLNPHTFYEPTANRQIAIRELGMGEACNDFMDHLGGVGDLKHEKGMKEAIAELKSLIRGHRMYSNSPGKLKFTGPQLIELLKR